MYRKKGEKVIAHRVGNEPYCEAPNKEVEGVQELNRALGSSFSYFFGFLHDLGLVC